MLMIGASVFRIEKQQSAFALTEYQTGFNFGVSDGMGSCIPPHKCGQDEYIVHLGSSFAFHTKEFNRGYVAGWCSVNPPHSGSILDEALWDCDKGPDSWNYEIKG